MNFKRFELNLIHLNTIDSTNNYAANLLKETNVVNGTTILTKRQESGKGQRGNTWHTEPEKNLILSTILSPLITSGRMFYLNILISLAVEKTLRDLGIKAKVKWPNDIYVGDKKIAGILIENQVQGNQVMRSIMGLGLNVNQFDFPAELNATSIALEKGVETDLMDVFMQFFGYLDFWFDQLMQGNYNLLLTNYYEVLFRYREKARYKDQFEVFEGEITGVNAVGNLMIDSPGGSRVYGFKEVVYLI